VRVGVGTSGSAEFCSDSALDALLHSLEDVFGAIESRKRDRTA
jgi:hypothetical protein